MLGTLKGVTRGETSAGIIFGITLGATRTVATGATSRVATGVVVSFGIYAGEFRIGAVSMVGSEDVSLVCATTKKGISQKNRNIARLRLNFCMTFYFFPHSSFNLKIIFEIALIIS